MPLRNENFILLLEESRSICSLKLEAFELKAGQGDAQLKQLRDRAKTTYEAFRNPKFVFIKFDFDEPKIREFLIDITETPDDNFSGFKQHLDGMLNFLKDTTLKDAADAVNTRSTTIVNAEILAALSTCFSKITKRINAFIAAGQNIRRHPPFLLLEENQDKARPIYREKLKNNTIKGLESHTLHIINLGNLIALSKDVPKFLSLYKRLTQFMENQI